MSYHEVFDIAAFRSRNHALKFNQIINGAGYSSQIISTPRELSLGCGLSVCFSPHITPHVIELYKKYTFPVIGFYSIERIGSSTRINRIPHE